MVWNFVASVLLGFSEIFEFLCLFSCPGSSIPDLGQSVSQSVSQLVPVILECGHKELLLTLETLQTFDQSDVWKKDKKTKRQKPKREFDIVTKRQKEKINKKR